MPLDPAGFPDAHFAANVASSVRLKTKLECKVTIKYLYYLQLKF